MVCDCFFRIAKMQSKRVWGCLLDCPVCYCYFLVMGSWKMPVFAKLCTSAQVFPRDLWWFYMRLIFSTCSFICSPLPWYWRTCKWSCRNCPKQPDLWDRRFQRWVLLSDFIPSRLHIDYFTVTLLYTHLLTSFSLSLLTSCSYGSKGSYYGPK